MEAIHIEFPAAATPTWLEEMVDEFTEDPHCHFVMLGGDDEAVVLVSMWPAEIAPEVEAGLRSLISDGTSIRRLRLVLPVVGRPERP